MQDITATLPPNSRRFLEWAARRVARNEASIQVIDERTAVFELRDVITRRIAIGFHQATPILGLQSREFEALTGIMWAGVDTEVFSDEAAIILSVALIAPATVQGVEPRTVRLRIPATPPSLVPVIARALKRVGAMEIRPIAVGPGGGAVLQPSRPISVNFVPYSGTGD